MAVFVLAFLAVPGTARAHGDVGLVDGVVPVALGGTARFEGRLHYHRLVARFAADAPVAVHLVHAASGTAAVEAGRARTIELNRLVQCCEDVWEPFVLEISNSGPASVSVDAKARLVHDDLAVTVYGAESGTGASVVIAGALWAWILWRVTRRRGSEGSLGPALAAFGVLVAGVLGLALFGAARYGSGGPPALIAATADIPLLPTNPAVSWATLLMLALMIGWAWAGARWARSRATGGRAPWALLGLALVGSVGVTAALMATAYGATAVPLAWALIAAVPVMVVVTASLVDPTRSREPVA